MNCVRATGGVTTLLAILCSIAAADDLLLGTSTADSIQLSQHTIELACSLADTDRVTDLATRRPEGFGDIDSEEELRQLAGESIGGLRNHGEGWWSAASHLRYLGDFAFDALIEGLTDNSAQVRTHCVRILGARGAKAVSHLIDRLLNDDYADVRENAALMLGVIGDPKAIPALMQALPIADTRLLRNTIDALGTLHAQEAFIPIQQVLLDTKQDTYARQAAIRALFWINQEAGTAALNSAVAIEADSHMRVLLQQSVRMAGYGHDWPPHLLELRQLANDAATIHGEKFGKAETDKLLIHTGSSHSDVSSGCLMALAELKAYAVVDAITQLDPAKYPAAHIALARIGSRDAVSFLLNEIQIQRGEQRKQAVDALGESGSRWAVPVLVELLDDPSLRSHHALSIPEIGGPWPDQHLAYDKLSSVLKDLGYAPRSVNLCLSQGSFEIDKELEKVRGWWRRNEASFIAGESIRNPSLAIVFASS